MNQSKQWSAIREETGQGEHLQSPVRKQWTRGRVYEYTPGPFWSHLRYGLGTLAVLVLPPLIPAVTGRVLMMGYLGLLVAIYETVCAWGVAHALRRPAGGAATRR